MSRSPRESSARSCRSTPSRAPHSAAALPGATSPDLEVRRKPALELVGRPRLAALVARRVFPQSVDDQSVLRTRVDEVARAVAVLHRARLDLHRAELPERVLERDRPIVEVALLESPAGAGPCLLHPQRHRMHRREDVDPVRPEDAGDLADDPLRVRHEDQRVVVLDDVERSDVVDRDAARQGTLSQHWFRCASRKCRTRASSYAGSSSIQFQAVSTIVPGATLSYGRISSFTSPYLSF